MSGDVDGLNGMDAGIYRCGLRACPWEWVLSENYAAVGCFARLL